MKIQYIAGIHGNEVKPIQALQDKKIDFILANPKAYEKQVRFIEKDMNTSFGTDGKSYEEKQARKILKKIRPNSIVIDFHTTLAETETFCIVVDPKMIPFAQTLGIKNIVYMKHNIKSGHSLIDHRKGVSVEVGQHNDPECYQRTLSVLKRNRGETKIFEVYDVISKPGNYKNFRDAGDEFIPILAGKNSYEHYGLKARVVDL
jgi:hypothetical protein